MKRELTAWPAVLGLCALVACELGGSGNGGNGPGPDVTVTLGSTASLDGWVRTDGNAQTTNGLTGDLSVVTGQGYRQFFSFDLSTIPPGSTVTSATLRLYQAFVIGSPYTELGSVAVDHLDYGDMLCCGDYDAAALASAGTLSSDASVGYKQLVVTARVQADLAAARTRTQFRLRFSAADFTNDGGSDNAQFNEAEAPGGNLPQLVVTYH